MRRLKSSAVTISILCSLFTQNAFASCKVGKTVFTDVLYGTAIGAGVGTLVLLANKSSDNIVSTIATAGLIGAGVGAGVGIAELSLQNCKVGGGDDEAQLENPSFSVRPLISLSKIPESNHFFDNLSAKNFLGGVQLKYNLN